MTDKEKAIVMAHTGICMLTGDKFPIYHKYVEDIMGRPIMTHELVMLEDTIKEKSKADFIALCADEDSSEKMKTHEIKLSVEFLEPVLYGKKRFEVRKNDRGYQKGDHIRFTVVGDTMELARLHNEVYAIEKIEYEITYVISGWGIENGYVVFGIDEIGEVGEKQEDKDKKLRLRTKGEKEAYLDGFEMCAECIESYLKPDVRQYLRHLLVVVKKSLKIEDIEPQESVDRP